MSYPCPVTGGLPTSMTKAGFEYCCAKKRQEAAEEELIESREFFLLTACLHCSGIPAELTLIMLPELPTSKETTMTEKTKKSICEFCRRPAKSLKNSHGKQTCSMCCNLRTMANSRPALLIDALQEFAPDLLGGSADLELIEALREDLVIKAREIDTLKIELTGQELTINNLREDALALVEEVAEQELKIQKLQAESRAWGEGVALTSTGIANTAIEALGWSLITRMIEGTVTGVHVDDLKTLLQVQ